MLDASHNRGFDLESSYDDFFNYGIYRLRNFILGDNPNLTILDLGENQIENLDFPFLPNLMMLSLRENNFQRRFVEVREKQSLIMRSPKLIFLDYHVSDIEE
jgi:Leucine-rich repeat (LRR) protein